MPKFPTLPPVAGVRFPQPTPHAPAIDPDKLRARVADDLVDQRTSTSASTQIPPGIPLDVELFDEVGVETSKRSVDGLTADEREARGQIKGAVAVRMGDQIRVELFDDYDKAKNYFRQVADHFEAA